MLQNKFLQTISAILLFAISFTACKKDAFSEKDAIDAQTTLLQRKFDNERSLEQLRQQGVTANIQLTFQLTLQNQLALNRNKDSIDRAYQRFVDSMSLVLRRNTDSISARNARNADIIISVRDITNTTVAVSGATVTLPTTVGTVLQTTTDANGIAYFPGAGNTNVPFTVQAIVTRTGWTTALSGFLIRNSSVTNTSSVTPSLAATVELYNDASRRNTYTGNVSIENNLTNNTSDPMVGQPITLTNSFNGQQLFYTGTTNASGNYSISLPDGSVGSQNTSFRFLPTTKDTTSTLYVNSLVPGIDSIASVQTVSARFTLGLVSGSTNIPNTTINGTLFGGPSGAINRFNAVVVNSTGAPLADSLGRFFYVKNLSLNATSNGTIINFYPTGNLNQAVSSNVDFSFGQQFTPRFNVPESVIAGANTATLALRFVDLLNNADGAITRIPTLQATINFFGSTFGPAPTFSPLTGLMTVVSSTGFPNFNSTNVSATRSTAVGNLNNYNPTAVGIASGNLSPFNLNNSQVTNRALVNSSNSTPTGITISGGVTVVAPQLTFGQGTLLAGVR
jgi:hypothetical protein